MKHLTLTSLLLTASLYPLSAQPAETQKSYAIIDLSVACLRAAPDFESPLETQELMGAVVEVQERQGYWVKVHCNQPYDAWCTEKSLHEVSSEQAIAWTGSDRQIVTVPYSRIYTAPDKNSHPVSDLCKGDLVATMDSKPVRGWMKVSTPGGRAGWTPASDLQSYACWSASRKATGASLVAEAKQWVGVPYLWGGMSPKGFDCSGLVRFVYLMNGVHLPRNASQMAKCGNQVTVFKDDGVTFTAENLQSGDLLFFGRKSQDGKPAKVTHVGMYIGDGRMIHASQLVRNESVFGCDEDCYPLMCNLLSAVRIL
ncbi:MAG: NlpC/P60 family protein [Candidatus Cryptobacteroides sp.]